MHPCGVHQMVGGSQRWPPCRLPVERSMHATGEVSAQAAGASCVWSGLLDAAQQDFPGAAASAGVECGGRYSRGPCFKQAVPHAAARARH